jgi:putative ABC transport system ATP-binding protein
MSSPTPNAPAPVVPASVALTLHGLSCDYPGSAGIVHALRPLDLEVRRGAFLSIMGPSGSGKTTLLHCAAGLQRPTAGWVELAGRRIDTLTPDDLAAVRRRSLGFVFQSFDLVDALTAAQNVELPIRLDRRRPDPSQAAALLRDVGLAERGDHRPDRLSGGQKQRVAIARALVARPEIVFADEPTGALDLRSARDVLALLRRLADGGQTIVMVTHDPVAASFSDEVLFLADGAVVDRLPSPTADAVAARMTTLVDTAEAAS